MKFSPSLHWRGAALVLLAGTALALRGELLPWAQETIAVTPLEAALFRLMGLPDGQVMHFRPPWEARAHLTGLIGQTPRDSALYALRAREEERSQDYTAAEADWKQAAAESKTKRTSLAELADFYRRRVDPAKELDTLLQLGNLPEDADERFQPSNQQPQWAAFTRAVELAHDSLLPPAQHEQVYSAWIQRYRKEVAPYQAYLDWAIRQRNRKLAGSVAARLKAAFPHDAQLSVSTDANLARVESGNPAALAVYSKNFSPLWPEALRTSYFQELTASHQLRVFLGDAQAAAAANQTSLDPAFRLCFYYEQEGRKDLAAQQLLTLLSRRAAQHTAWTAPELKTVAALLLRLANYDESARVYYMLYQLPSASTNDHQLALSALISMLLDVPEQPLHFSNRDLSLYKNVAQMDRHPGFLNGILSLALNTTAPDYQYQNASQTAVAYFHRAAASQLIDKLQQQFPTAPQAPELEAKLFSAYASYGQEDALIRLVPGWMNRNRNVPDYVSTSLLLADAYSSKRNTKAELALYSRLLTELANSSGHMPIGPAGVLPREAQPNLRQPIPDNVDNPTEVAIVSSGARSPDYARVLDRYISRLVQLQRPMDAVALFRGEIDRNPDDPGIYERLALFLEQNRLDSDVEQTYRDALNHFKDMSWASKLGRFYLRQQQEDAYRALAHQITDTFKGSELATFLSEVTPSSAQLYRQVNLYAHRRFPYNLTFVHNLLAAYRNQATRDDSAYEKLLGENWFNDSQLRITYFQFLSSTGRLESELASLPAVEQAAKDSNLAALEFRADANAWLTNYEAAAPVFVRLASLTPGDSEATDHAISVERSLAPNVAGAFDSAVHLAEQQVHAEPQDRAAITRVGEIYADREMYSQARPWWNRVAAVQPGASSGYLDSATVFWDYFQFKDSLRVIADARQKLANPALFGYEAGAIYENEGENRQAIDSYIQAALHDGSEPSKARLIKLAQRKATALLVEQQTARLTTGAFNSAAFELRLSLLEKQSRRDEIQAMLTSLLPQASQLTEVQQIREVAERLGFDDIAARCQERTIAMSSDPIEKIQARIDLAQFHEKHNDPASAQRDFTSLLQDEPNRLGVIRAVVDFDWRQKQSQAAVATLASAAERAQPPYRDQLRREAAEKATNSRQFDEARRLLDQLLTADPFNGDLLAEKASTYALQQDNPGLLGFYAAALKSMQAAPLPAPDKTARLAALRRGYILALITGSQFTDALEQYQLVLNAYPDDPSLAAEVARFADAHQLGSRLIGYYAKATSDSPHDYRWPLVLARLETSLRQYPEAISAYDKAAYVRPDRADLFAAKADLETRLLRFNDALKSYAKLYDLSFHDSQYLADQAELHARLGKKAEALRLLRAAYIAPRPNEPGGYVSAMQQASKWRMFAEVDGLFRELQPKLASDSGWKQEGLQLEIEALLALHRPADALHVITAVLQPNEAASFSTSFGSAVHRYLTPPEKAVFAQQISQPAALPEQLPLLDLSKAAGLYDVEAAELVRLAKSNSQNRFEWGPLDTLQSSRLLFEPLGQQLEAIAQSDANPNERPPIFSLAFTAYERAGDTASQLRLTDYAGGDFARLFVLAGGDLNGRLAVLAQQNHDRANQVVEYLITNSSPDTAIAAVAARGRNLTPLWVNSYTALTGLYWLAPAAWVEHSFDHVLGPRTVGDEINAQSAQDFLRDASWFYYAARFGDYLGQRKLPRAQDYLPAPLEAGPAASNSYAELARTYQDLKQPAQAIQLYHQALQLSPDRADIYDRLALIDSANNRRVHAVAQWKRAFEILTARVEKGPLPQDYWTTARALLAHVNRSHALGELQPSADLMLRTYARRNGTYQFEPFLEGIFDHPADRRAALDWVLELSRMPGMANLVSEVLNSPRWIEAADKDPVYRAEIQRARDNVSASAGQAAVAARVELNRQLVAYGQYLSDQKRWPEQWTLLQQIQPQSDVPAEQLLTAGALTGHLTDLLSRFHATPATAPTTEQLLAVSSWLPKQGHSDLSIQLEEYEYGRELEASSPPASAWFGMAKVRFQQKRNDEGLSLIRNVTIAVGSPFENLPEAVRLLEEWGLKQQASQYALEWKTAEPWNEEAQLAYAKLEADSKALDGLRRQDTAPYELRVQAARLLRSLNSPATGSDELSLLTHQSISPAESSQPFYVAARLDAAHESSEMSERMKLYQDAIALEPSLHDERLSLAEAAFATKDHVLGLAAFNSFGQTQSAVPDNFVKVEEMAAEAYSSEHRWAPAQGLYRDLLKRVQDPSQRRELSKAASLVRQKQNIETANLSRRPVVTNKVTQPGIVRPKLATEEQ